MFYFLQQVNHKNIVQLIGASWDKPPNVCIVMEYVPNGDLSELLHKDPSRPLSWAHPLFKIACGIGNGLQYLHESHIVHRDVKVGFFFALSNLFP